MHARRSRTHRPDAAKQGLLPVPSRPVLGAPGLSLPHAGPGHDQHRNPCCPRQNQGTVPFGPDIDGKDPECGLAALIEARRVPIARGPSGIIFMLQYGKKTSHPPERLHCRFSCLNPGNTTMFVPSLAQLHDFSKTVREGVPCVPARPQGQASFRPAGQTDYGDAGTAPWPRCSSRGGGVQSRCTERSSRPGHRQDAWECRADNALHDRNRRQNIPQECAS